MDRGQGHSIIEANKKEVRQRKAKEGFYEEDEATPPILR